MYIKSGYVKLRYSTLMTILTSENIHANHQK